MLPQRLRFGAFIAPFHPLDENPTLAIQRDLELVQWMDQLGFDEAWIGEHHSAAYELIASPEVFIAAAAERTKHIRLGTGVSSLPYHHPLMLADRINQLDHMTRGRVMFGAGPGALVSDAFMMGIPVAKQRDRMDEALGCIVRLLRGEEVTHKSDWFELDRARLQMTPYSRPSVEIAVASQVSPTGARAAGAGRDTGSLRRAVVWGSFRPGRFPGCAASPRPGQAEGWASSQARSRGVPHDHAPPSSRPSRPSPA